VPGGFTYTFGYIFFWWLVLYWMYRRRIFLRL
jgi:predicted acyltransferase